MKNTKEVFVLLTFAIFFVTNAQFVNAMESAFIEVPEDAVCSKDRHVFGDFPSSCGCPEGYAYGGAQVGKCWPKKKSIAVAENARCSADRYVFGDFPSSCGCPEDYVYGGAHSGRCLLNLEQ